MEHTTIQWTDHTFNPWQGCCKVSAGCAHCYAETLNNRNLHGEKAIWGKDGFRRRNSDFQWSLPHAWNRKAEREGMPHLVFCASMADVFEDNKTMPLDEWREELHGKLIVKTPWLKWQLLTKRPENVREFYGHREILPNIWLGTSVENQDMAELRIPHLLQNKAPVRFLSCEPLLGPLDLSPWLAGIDWVIVGGESGHGWRSMNTAWVRSIHDQCRRFKVPFFFKQWAGLHPKSLGRELDGNEWNEFPEL